jgi:hypothetical protein
MTPAYRVLVYHGTTNLGDAVQTAAISRLLPGRLVGLYRHQVSADGSEMGPPLVVNGWLGGKVPAAATNGLFAGVFLGRREEKQLQWLRDSRHAIGARDPFTAALLRSRGVASEMIGCATLTLERYRGPRAGRIAVDWFEPYTTFQTNWLDPAVRWSRQWALALELLGRLRTAAIVYTSRLHVALPCLAFGTPVEVARRAVTSGHQPERFTLLDAMGFAYDEPVTMDVTPWADRYVRFLSAQVGRALEPGPYNRPEAEDIG